MTVDRLLPKLVSSGLPDSDTAELPDFRTFGLTNFRPSSRVCPGSVLFITGLFLLRGPMIGPLCDNFLVPLGD